MPERPQHFEGSVTIRWPGPTGMQGWKASVWDGDGHMMAAVCGITVHADPESFIWTELTMLTDDDGRPLRGDDSNAPAVVHLDENGHLKRAVFAYEVAAMTVGEPPLLTVNPGRALTDEQARQLEREFSELAGDSRFKFVTLPARQSALHWAGALDDDDRAAFLADLAGAASAGDLAALERHLDGWQVTAEALADPERRAVLTGAPEDADFTEVQRPGEPGYCRHCDVFVGFGAAGVARAPDEHADDREWLGSHCWVCGRSREEIASGR